MIEKDFFLPYQQETKFLMISFFLLVQFRQIFVYETIDLFLFSYNEKKINKKKKEKLSNLLSIVEE